MAFDALTGICAAPFLPMRPDYAIDWDVTEAYLRWVAEQRPAAIAMNMDASEGPSLTRDEQLEVVRVASEAIVGLCPLYSGLIADSTADAVAFAHELVAAGAEGLAVFPPLPVFLGQPVDAGMIADFHAAIGDAAGCPIVGFQFPLGMGPDFTPVMLQAVAALPAFVVGLKEASFDLLHTRETIAAAMTLPRKLGILTGSDTFIMEAFVMGCDGALIAFAGTATAELVAMHRAVSEGDFARGWAIWDRLGPLARYCWRPPIRDYRPRMKEVLLLQGLFPHATVRPPQLPVDDAERAQLRRLAAAAGLLGDGEIRAAE